jgi:hypothetical protein
MEPTAFDDLQQTLASRGPAAAIDTLCDRLRQGKDYPALFNALLMKKRHELGVSPLPSAPSAELPPEAHEPFENAIREAARLVGGYYLADGNVPQAWPYFRLINEPGPVVQALADYRPGPDDDVHPVVQLAFYENLHPRKGFDLILERFGTCNAITTMSNPELPVTPETRTYCYQQLVRTLHRELRERLAADIRAREGSAPESDRLRDYLAGRDWLFESDFAHIDTSHLGAVVQMSVHLPRCEELGLARELCEYGRRLPERLRYQSDPPFEDQYADYAVFLAVLAGDDVEKGVAHFRAKAEKQDGERPDTYPAEVLVNLLLRLDRTKEALEVARRRLAGVDPRRLSCPSVGELCQRVGDYRTLAEAAREQGDAVHYLAGLIAAGKNK